MLAFVYGTLTDRDRVAAVVEEFSFEGPATLEGLRRVDGDYPTLVPGGDVEGRLLRTPSPGALDGYESVATGLYVRASVPVADRAETATVYVGNPDRLDAEGDWPGSGTFDDRVQAYLRDHEAVVRPE